MRALDLVEPEDSHDSTAYRLARSGDSKADLVIERDCDVSDADNRKSTPSAHV